MVRWRTEPPHPDLIPASDPLGDESSSNGVMMIGSKGITTGVYGFYPKLYRKGEQTLKFDTSNQPGNEFGHQSKWIAACKSGFNSNEHKSLTSSFDYAGPMTETVLMGNIAIRSYMEEKKERRFSFLVEKNFYGMEML